MKNQDLAKTIEIRNEKGQVVGTAQVVWYPELLDKAHNDGLKGIKTKIEQLPNESNGQTAIFSAQVELEKGIFFGTGDANPDNVAREIAPHFIRAAETRAKARALRDALNIPIVAIEELGKELTNGKLLLGILRASPNDSASPGRNNNKKSKISGGKDSSGGKESGSVAKNASKKPPTKPPENAKKGQKPKEETKDYSALMTEAQRRYLFRLMAERGIYGDEAHTQLKNALKVDSLKKGTKAQASNLIEQLVKESEEVPF